MPDQNRPMATQPGSPDDQRAVVKFLASARSYPDKPRSVSRHDTHGAMIFLAGSYAYKIKRAVRFSYMDFSTLEKRRQALDRELSINRPHAPDLYLDIVAITREKGGRLAFGGPGEPVEWVLRMRRFDQADLLSERAKYVVLDTPLCRRLADAVFAFHKSARIAATVDSPQQMHALAHEVTDELGRIPGGVPPQQIAAFARDCVKEIAETRAILEKRARGDCIRRCHGDLHLGNIVMWHGAPVLFDALEFDESLATIDTLYDLAFLLMDLDHRKQRSAANAVLNRYLWQSQSPLDLEGLAALPLFLALRAGVRAMVTAQRAAQENGDTELAGISKACGYLAAACAHLHRILPRMIAIGGLSGTGKSTLGAALAPEIGKCPGAVHLRSDLERKAHFGVAETERLPPSAYLPDVDRTIYDRLLEKAGIVLAAGHSVIVDAVFARADERVAAEALARKSGVPFVGLWLEAPPEQLIARVGTRRGDASDATPDVVRKQLSYDPGTIGWATVAAGGSATATLSVARARLRQLIPA